MSMRPRTVRALLHTEAELAEERASALARIGRRLEELLRSLEAVRARWQSLAGHQRDRALEEYRQLHEEARRYRWYLEVQREAVGLRGHHVIDRSLPLPPPSPFTRSPRHP